MKTFEEKICVTRANKLMELLKPYFSSFCNITSEHNVKADEVAIDLNYLNGASRIGRTRIFARIWIHGDSRTDDIRISPTLYYDMEKSGLINKFEYDHPPVLSKGYYYLCLVSPDTIGVVKNLLAAMATYEDITKNTSVANDRYNDLEKHFLSKLSSEA